MSRNTRVFLAGVVALAGLAVGVAIGARGDRGHVRARPVDTTTDASTSTDRPRASDAPRDGCGEPSPDDGRPRLRGVAAGPTVDPCTFPDQLRRWLREGADGLAACSTEPE